MENSNLDVLALSKTKLKGKGEIMFGDVKGRKSGIRESYPERANEGVFLLVRDGLESHIKERKEI